MSKKVNTVLGPISVNELGKTLMHEHFVFGYPGYIGNSLYPLDKEEAIRVGIEVAKRVQSFGVKTIVDPTPNEGGRDPEILKEIAERTGLNIICSTGYYYEGEGAPAYFKVKMAMGTAEEELYELFITEIQNGIGKTGIKPGVIKLATSENRITRYEQLFFKVAAKVHRETGIPIITHTQKGTMGPEQAELLVSEGVNPKNVLIGHMDGNTDIEYHIRTLEQGVFVGFDRFGVEKLAGMPMDREKIQTFSRLIELGYTDQLMLAHDTVNYWLGKPPVWREEVREIVARWEPGHIFENIIPKFKEVGITEEQLDKILIENPKVIFGDNG